MQLTAACKPIWVVMQFEVHPLATWEPAMATLQHVGAGVMDPGQVNCPPNRDFRTHCATDGGTPRQLFSRAVSPLYTCLAT
jgi:hypothetical protein